MTSTPHPYQAARLVLQSLRQIFLEHGDRLWSVSPVKDGEENFAHLGLDLHEARKAFKLLVEKGLAEYRGVDGFVITDYGIAACDHPSTLEYELPLPNSTPDEITVAEPSAIAPSPTTSSNPLDEFLPAGLGARFTIVHQIGGGSFGTVYLVTDLESFRRFALKVTIPAPDARQRAVREVEAADSLKHENILEVIERDGKGAWFLLPLAEGTLGQLQSWGRLDPGAALSVAYDVGRALVHAHGQEFVHRDLHVDNIFRFDGKWRVGDWGLTVARNSERMTRTRSVGGIQTWTAPEQLASLKNADERSDLYSLGRIVEWLAAGVLPEITRPGTLASGHPLAAFVNAATQLEPDARPPSVSDALALLPGGQVVVPSVSVPKRTRASMRTIEKGTIDRALAFHAQRLALAQSGKTVMAIDPRPAVILHVFPHEENIDAELLRLKDAGVAFMPPERGIHWLSQFNHDGLAVYWPGKPRVVQCLQIFRDGCLEFVDAYGVQRGYAPKQVLLPLNLERDIVHFIEHWERQILPSLNAVEPRVVCVSIFGIKDFELHIDDDRRLFGTNTTFDRDVLSFRPVILDGKNVREAMKPLFDAIWQAAGEDRSLGYSRSGEWLEQAHPKR